MNTADWQQQFDKIVAAKNQPSWLVTLREQAFSRWQQQGFPSMRDERWKYTELMPLAQTDFQLFTTTATAAYQDLLPATIAQSLRIVIVDGKLVSNDCAALNDAQIYCASLADALQQMPQKMEALFNSNKTLIDSIDDLNTALSSQGLVIVIAKNSKITQPIHLVYIHTAAQNTMLHLQNYILLDEGAEATLIEHHLGQDDSRYFSTLVNTIQLEQHAQLTLYRWQEQGLQSYHINRLYLNQAASSIARLFNMDLKGHLIRNETMQIFNGEHAQCHLSGLYLGKGKQHIDNYITLQHQQPHCVSTQLFKGILDDRSHCVFSGKVVVAKDAQKTDASQHNANLILSTQAEIDTQPQLEIYADDVKCTHGATVGQLDEDALFYLQSRGLSAAMAKQILVYSFAASALQAIEQETIRKVCQQRLSQYFPDMPASDEVMP